MGCAGLGTQKPWGRSLEWGGPDLGQVQAVYGDSVALGSGPGPVGSASLEGTQGGIPRGRGCSEEEIGLQGLPPAPGPAPNSIF